MKIRYRINKSSDYYTENRFDNYKVRIDYYDESSRFNKWTFACTYNMSDIVRMYVVCFDVKSASTIFNEIKERFGDVDTMIKDYIMGFAVKKLSNEIDDFILSGKKGWVIIDTKEGKQHELLLE